MRALAGNDPGRYEQVLDWPVAEAMEAYQQMLRREAGQQYKLQVLMWAVLAQSGATRQKRPPKPPKILSEG